METGLPNIFNQYSVDENRVTNALLQTLASSPVLAKSFLKQFLGLRPGRSAVLFSAQKKPKALGDRTDTPEAEKDKDTVPDGWIYSEEEDWFVVIESKIYPKTVRAEQLVGHLGGIRPSKDYLLVLTPDKKKPEPLLRSQFRKMQVIWHPWEKIHRWAARNKDVNNTQSAAGLLIRRLKEYLEMHEDLSEFQGIDFSEGFEPQRAKLLLKSLMDKIEDDVRDVYHELTERRPRITLGVSDVWDCFDVKPVFTSDLHFTIGIGIVDGTTISLTVPNAAKKPWRQLEKMSKDGELNDTLCKVLRTLSSKVPEFWIRLEQRHFIGRTRGVRDAVFDFKIETYQRGSQKSGTKIFPLWYQTFLSALQSKRRGNFQLQFRARFRFSYEKMNTPEFADVALETVKAFKPLYQMIKKER